MNNKFKQVLFIGPQYQGQRGGMASVLSVYSKSMTDFKFIPTYHNKNLFYNCIYFLKALFKVIKTLITDREIKVVHLHSASRGSFFRKSIIILIAKVFQKKTVLHIHGGEFKIFYNNSGLLKFLIRGVLNLTDELVCLSEEWKSYFNSICKKPKSIVINNPVQLPTGFVKPSIAEPIKVLYLNHINPKKGIFDVVTFFKNNQQKLQGHFKLVIAGAGDDAALHQIINENNLGLIIEHKGWIEGNEKNELIQDSHLFILTSYNEGLPMSILEAMSFGKPIIASNVGGIPQIVKPAENGWLVNPGSQEDLDRIFQELEYNQGLIDTYGTASLQIVKAYATESVNLSLQKMYDRLLMEGKKEIQ